MIAPPDGATANWECHHGGLARYPMLRGIVRDHATLKRRPLVRFFACEEDITHDSPDEPLPAAIASGAEPFLIVGAVAGG